MYLPAHFEETRSEVLHALMRARPLATLVTQSAQGLAADALPLLLCADQGPCGTLRGHVARANPLWHECGGEALAVFQGPQAYVSPSWYPAKHEHGKVVPTWNYVVVQARGRLRVIDDAAWLRRQVEALTARQEAGFARPWAVADAPRAYTDRMIEAIVGIEIEITRLAGKWKLSQNQPEANRAGVVDGLRTRGGDEARQLADLVEAARSPTRPEEPPAPDVCRDNRTSHS